MVKLKVATLIHIWVDWLRLPGAPSGCLGTWSNPALSWDIPEYPCDLPMDCHPVSKGTEMIHARNFRVQPQAIMGSSIVE